MTFSCLHLHTHFRIYHHNLLFVTSSTSFFVTFTSTSTISSFPLHFYHHFYLLKFVTSFPPPPFFATSSTSFFVTSTSTSTISSFSHQFYLLKFVTSFPPPPFSSPPPPPPQFRHFVTNSTSSISSPPSLRPPPSPQFCHLLSSSSFSSPPPHLHLHKFVTSFRPPLLHSLLMSAPPFHFSHLFPFRHLLHLLHLLLFREVLPYLLLFITSIFLISSSPLHLYLHYLKFVTSSHLLVFIITSLSSSPSPFPYAFPPPRFLLYLLHLLLFRHLLLHLPLVPFLLRPPPRKRVTERGGRLPRAWWRGVTRD